MSRIPENNLRGTAFFFAPLQNHRLCLLREKAFLLAGKLSLLERLENLYGYLNVYMYDAVRCP